MKKSIYFLSFFLCCYISQAQFKTKYNEFGDPTSEIIDALSMKQGDWIYYNNKNQIIRIDSYKDNQLIQRKCFINNSEITNIGFVNFETVNIETNDDFSKYNGEAIINEKGKVLLFSIYNNDNLNTDDNKIIDNLKSYILKLSKSNKKTILIF